MRLIFAFSFLFSFSPALASGQKLLFFEEARVLGERVRLIDLIDTKSLREDEIKRLALISIATSPKENSVLTIEERALAQVVRVHRLTEKFEAPIKIPNEIRVIGPEAAWNETNFRIHLAVLAKLPGSSVKIEALRLPPQRPELENSRWTIDNSLISSWKGSVTVPVRFKTTQGKEVTEWVTAQIKHLRPSAVSLRYLKHGDRITKDDFVVEMRDSSRSLDASPTAENIIGKKLNRAIPVGQIIWSADFEKNKMVERGQMVDLLHESEGLRIKMTGIAQDDGGLGDRVRIQNQDSKKVVSAVVVGNARVELK